MMQIFNKPKKVTATFSTPKNDANLEKPKKNNILISFKPKK